MKPGGKLAGSLYECWYAPLLVLHIGSIGELYVFATHSVPFRSDPPFFFLLVFPILYHIVCFSPGGMNASTRHEVWCDTSGGTVGKRGVGDDFSYRGRRSRDMPRVCFWFPSSSSARVAVFVVCFFLLVLGLSKIDRVVEGRRTSLA